MTNELICFDCLTEDNRREAAITTVSGTAVCEKCARERAEIQDAMADQASQRQQEIFDQLGSVMGRNPLIGG